MSSISNATPTTVVIPQFGRIYLSVIWVEAVLLGINLVCYAASIHVLVRRNRTNWLLVAWSTLLICLSSADAMVGFAQLYRPLTNPNIIGVPGAWDAAYLLPDALDFAHSELYSLVVIFQDYLLIWRLYVVWGKNWKVALGPLILEMLHTALSFYATHFLAHGGQNAFGASVQHWGLASWSIDIFVNTTTTLAIAGRLWWMGRKNNSSGGRYTYRASMWTIVESGAIFAGATIVLFGIDVSGSIGGVAGLYPLTQLGSITPLLIIVRIGLGLTHGENRVVTTVTNQTNGTGPLAFARRPIAVNVDRFAATETDDTYSMSRMTSHGKDLEALEQPFKAAEGPIP